jgi:hypothetical protein
MAITCLAKCYQKRKKSYLTLRDFEIVYMNVPPSMDVAPFQRLFKLRSTALLGLMVHAYYLSTWEAKAGGLHIQG